MTGRGHREGKDVHGALYLLDYQTDPPVSTNLTSHFEKKDFHPHGISFYHDLDDSTKWVFAVSHGDDGHVIERFQFTDSSLIHVESITHGKIASPNDLVAVGKRQFYFTNDHDQAGNIDRWKDYLLIGTAQIGFYDGKDVEILHTGLGYSNGINISKDKKHLFVANSIDLNVVIYDRNDGHKKVGEIPCGTGVDNIELDENGHLWIGSHPQSLKFVAHSKDAAERSPSQVLKIELNTTDFSKSIVEEVYLNDGNPLSASSVAAVDGDILMMGCVFDDGVGVTRWK